MNIVNKTFLSTWSFACKCLVAFSFCFLTNYSKSQTDTKFWFVAPEVTHGSYKLDYPNLLRVTSAGQAAIVKVQKPADNSFSTITITLSASESKTIDLTSFLNQIENSPADKVLNNGIYIESTTPIGCYYEVASELNPELFALKGKNALGTEFLIPSQNIWKNGWQSGNYNPKAFSAFDIVATENNTAITITTKSAIIGHGSNQTFTIYLNKGQTYSATSASDAANQQLGGAKVTSDKPIAITLKLDCLYAPAGCADLAGDQIVSLNSIGKEYVITKGFLTTEPEYVFVWAPKGAVVNVSTTGSKYSTTISAQGFHSIKITNQRYHILANNPVYVSHFSGFGCELGMALIPSVCSGSKEVTLTRTSNDNFGLMIMTQTANKKSFKLNGSSAYIDTTQFDTVPGTSGKWSSARIVIDSLKLPKGNTVRLENTNGLFHVGMLNGGVFTGTGYGYFSNFVNTDFSSHPLPIIAEYCNFGDSLFVKMNDTGLSYTYQWYFNNVPITGANSPTLKFSSISEKDTGFYKCLVADGCFEIMSNTARVSVKNKTYFNQQINICNGDSVFLQGKYRKLAGNYTDTFKTSLNCDSIVITNLKLQSSHITYYQNMYICDGDSIFIEKQYRKIAGTYTDTINTANCDSIVITNLQIKKSLSTIKDTTICQGDSILIAGKYYKTVGTYYDTISSSGSCYDIVKNNLSVLSPKSLINNVVICTVDSFFFKNRYLKSTGTYIDTVYRNNCIDTFKQLNLTIKPSSVSFNELRVCSGDSVAYQGSYYNTDTIFYDTILLPQLCDSVAITRIREVGVPPQIDTGYFCEDSVPSIDAGNFTSYLWSDGSTKRFFNSNNDGKHWLQVKDTNNCVFIDTFFVFERCNPFFYIPNSFTPNGDGLNDYFYITSNNSVVGIDIKIFDRWGEIIFDSNDKNFKWYGVYKDRALPSGIYYWIVTVIGVNHNGKTIKMNDKGMIAIIR